MFMHIDVQADDLWVSDRMSNQHITISTERIDYYTINQKSNQIAQAGSHLLPLISHILHDLFDFIECFTTSFTFCMRN